MKKILIADTGAPELHKKVQEYLAKQKSEKASQTPLIIVDMTQIEVNGILYEEIQVDSPKKNYRGGKMLAMMSMMSLAYTNPYADVGRTSPKPRPNVNIVDEFKLIQEKKSKLSRSNREWVEAQFHKLFKRVSK